MERYHAGFAIVALVVVIGVAAIVLPRFVYTDTGDASAGAVLRLKTQARLVRSIPPLVSRATEAEQYGPTPDHVRGRVEARTLFGVRVGWFERSPQGQDTWDYDYRREMGVVAAFVAAQAALLTLAGWLFWSSA